MVLARSTDLVPYLSQLFLRNILQWLLWQEKLLKVFTRWWDAPYPYNFPSQLNSVSNLIMNAQGNSQRKTCRISVQMSIEIYKKKRESLSLWSICTQNRKLKRGNLIQTSIHSFYSLHWTWTDWIATHTLCLLYSYHCTYPSFKPKTDVMWFWLMD